MNSDAQTGKASQRYTWHEGWVSLPPGKAPVPNGRTHGIALDRNENLYVFRQDLPAMLVYSREGELIDSWGDYIGAHGLSLVEEDGDQFLWLTDQELGLVVKTSLNGTVVQTIAAPPYASQERYSPTWVAVNEVRRGGNGDIWVADGYGSSRVNRYDADGAFIGTIDGTEGAGRFECPHGIWFDSRKTPMELYVADRGNRRVQVFGQNGTYLRALGDRFLTSPDCFARDGSSVIIPELHGRLAVIDANDELLYYIGENPTAHLEPGWPHTNPLLPGKFNSPHAAAADASGNIYVAEWRVGGRLVKLEKL